MKTFPEVEERRKDKRFEVCEGAFAFINNTPFVIRNISKGGLKLQSVVFDDVPPQDMALDIFLKNENFYLQDIPVRLVSIANNHPKTPFSSLRVKCLGLQFGELNQQQKTRLDYFITRSAVAGA
ncbi:MAG: PilZ domain-containing protein [Desulfobulbaceae bacterium]|nr:PilZ domain-containing protein [Desulfobulbaceae bacterium]MDY0349789.1 PilZ domain-containing protein [Desulfobulbaceae bacterium]